MTKSKDEWITYAYDPTYEIQPSTQAVRPKQSPSSEVTMADKIKVVGQEKQGIPEQAISSLPLASPSPAAPLTREAVANAINEHPLIASLLYDVDLLPEQIREGDERREGYMFVVVEHMLCALRALKAQGGEHG